VTIADRECERAIAQALSEAFPDDGLVGEEGPPSLPAAGGAGSSTRSMGRAIPAGQ
jgi:fructose-1,6-bisphosphatase/inositol monophosphatase family enzyme